MKMIGKIILVEAKNARDRTAEAMSYGYPNEPDPELLLRRGRATLFATGAEAEAALTKTLRTCTELGHLWPKKYRYLIVTVETEQCQDLNQQ